MDQLIRSRRQHLADGQLIELVSVCDAVVLSSDLGAKGVYENIIDYEFVCKVLSLFSIYTNYILSNNSFLTLIKYADDMALVGRLKYEHSLPEYLLQIDA